MVPSDYTFERIVSKLKAFQESSDKLRLIHSHAPTSGHWAKQRDREHQRDLQAQRVAESYRATAAAAAAASAGLPPPKAPAPLPPPKRRPMPVGTYAGAYPALQSRLLVLDASFNPPTRAHAHMAKAAVRDVLKEQRAAVAAAQEAARAAARVDGVDPVPVVRPETRLLLLLAVANADKDIQPAPLEHRLAMIFAFMHHLRSELRDQGDAIPIDMAVTSEAFFAGKAKALKEESWYPHVQPRMTYKNCDEFGRRLPDKLQVPAIEFIAGFDTLVRILDPKYYKEEEKKEEGEATASASEQDVNMTNTEESSGQASSEPSATPLTPMMKALNPFFEQASLRVLLRPADAWGPRAEQKQYIAALGGAEGGAVGICSLAAVGGDNAWMRKVRIISEAGGSLARGVSSSKVRKRIEEGNSLSAKGYVYPLVQDWIQKRRLYKKPRPLKESSEDEEGMVEIKEFGAWKKSDFFD
ncbi:hypothetical protein PWT90_06107 [Aphanocladium album]|nr:hypothetical protein PWT90_06107 [Aphanocladium album]